MPKALKLAGIRLDIIDSSTNRPFRQNASHERAERMAHYALWLYERDNGTAPVFRLARVNIADGVVQLEDNSGATADIQVPNHDWQPVVIDFHAP